MPDPSSTNSSSNFNNCCFLCSSKTTTSTAAAESTDKQQLQHPSYHSTFIQLLSPTLIDESFPIKHQSSSSVSLIIDYCTKCSLKLQTTHKLIQQLEKLTVTLEDTRKEIVRQILNNYDVCSKRLSELNEFEEDEQRQRVQLIQQKEMLEKIISNFKDVYKQHDDDVQIPSQWSLSHVAVDEEFQQPEPTILKIFTSTGTQTTMTPDAVLQTLVPTTSKRTPELAYVKLERLNDDQASNSNLETLSFIQLKTEIDEFEDGEIGLFTEDQDQDSFESNPLQEIISVSNISSRRFTEPNHKCLHCLKSFRTAAILEAHINSQHLKIKPYPCDLCSKSFSCAKYLTNHRVIHPAAAPPAATSSSKPISSVAESVIPSILSLTCMNSNCEGFDGENEEQLAQHVGAEHLGAAAADSPKSFVCPKCGKDYSRGINLRKHEVAVHGECITVTRRYSAGPARNQKKIYRENISESHTAIEDDEDRDEDEQEIKHEEKEEFGVQNDQEEEDEDGGEDGDEVEEKEQVLQLESNSNPPPSSPSPVPPNPNKLKSKSKRDPKVVAGKVKQPFKCPHCHKILSSKVMWQMHINRHLNLKPYTCQICSRSFSSQMYFRDHQTTHPELEAQLQTLSCPDCDKTFRHEQHLLIHRAVHENVEDPNANKDDKIRKKVKTRIKREEIKGKGRLKLSILDPSACNFDGCGFKAKAGDEAELLAHVNKVHIHCIEDKLLHICSKCGANYKSGLALRRHQLSIHGSVTRVLGCDWVVDCHEEFPSLFKLRQHILDEHCGDNATNNNIVADQDDPAQPQENPTPSLKPPGAKKKRRRRVIHKCEECPSHPIFSSKMGLRIHMNAHANLRPYMCEICSFSTTRLQYLRHHQTKHPQLNLKEIKCPDCHKTFSNPNYLRIHRSLQHSKVHRVSCPHCDYGTYYEATLRQHIAAVHVGERKHICETCGVSYKTKARLNIHVRSHTGERPYVCSTCGKGFMDSGKLRNHKEIHDGALGILKYECKVCSKKFPVQNYLYIHMKSHK